MIVPILDNGHGGTINSHYMTKGKRSILFEGKILYEGCFNRWVVNRIKEELDRIKFPYYHCSPDNLDTSLKDRVELCNSIYKEDKNTYLLSIHANAGGGSGIEGFVSKNASTTSKEVAVEFLHDIRNNLELGMKLRKGSDSELYKREDFYVLKNTDCPAFLFECGFMDNPKDLEKLWDREWINDLVQTLVKTITTKL